MHRHKLTNMSMSLVKCKTQVDVLGTDQRGVMLVFKIAVAVQRQDDILYGVRCKQHERKC